MGANIDKTNVLFIIHKSKHNPILADYGESPVIFDEKDYLKTSFPFQGKRAE